MLASPHWSAHGCVLCAAVAVAAAWYVWARTPGDRLGMWGYIAAAAVVAYGALYMANI